MYIIEKLIKTYLKITKKNSKVIANDFVDNPELEDVLECEHNFMPIDSTGNVLACSKCGYLITKKRIKNNTQNNK